MKRRLFAFLLALLLICSVLVGCELPEKNSGTSGSGGSGGSGSGKGTSQSSDEIIGFASIEGIPDYTGKAYVVLNDNKPTFSTDEIKSDPYEYYAPLDSLGRCGVTVACVCKETMPTEDRESISSVKPSGWKNKEYSSDLVDGRYLYNRCHLIGFQLTGENANKENLITGTRYLNIEGMLPFENMVADYVKETGNHVMYRVTPLYAGNNLVASGCQLEGWSVEDRGEGICFNVFAYNVQPGITINYATGDNWLNGDAVVTESDTESEIQTLPADGKYVLNVNRKTIHLPTCSSVEEMSSANKKEHTGALEPLLAQGYKTCGNCMK